MEAFEALVEVADALISSGVSNVYELSYEALDCLFSSYEYLGQADGAVHGPFSGFQVASWVRSGAFPPSTQIRRVSILAPGSSRPYRMPTPLALPHSSPSQPMGAKGPPASSLGVVGGMHMSEPRPASLSAELMDDLDDDEEDEEEDEHVSPQGVKTTSSSTATTTTNTTTTTTTSTSTTTSSTTLWRYVSESWGVCGDMDFGGGDEEDGQPDEEY
jgi:hypothetical protein